MATLATLCYLTKNGKTLMLLSTKEEHFKKGLWNGLGGKLEKCESPEEAAIREFHEESGLKLIKPRLTGILSFPEQDGNDWYVFVYKASNFSGTLLEESQEGILKWIKNDDIFNLKMSEGDYIFLPWIFENKFFSAKFVYKNRKLENHSVVFY